MASKKTKKDIFSKPDKKRWLAVSAIFFILIFTCTGLLFGFEKAYADKFYPGIKIGYIDVSGQSKEEAFNQLKGIEENIQNKGLIFNSGEKEVSINPIVISTAPDLAKQILSLDLEQTLDKAFASGREGNFFLNLLSKLRYVTFGKNITVIYSLNEEELIDHLQASFADLEKLPVNAALNIENGQVEVIGETSGFIFDYQAAANKLKKNVESLNFATINLDLIFAEPDIKKEDTKKAIQSIEDILTINFIGFSYEDDYWKLEKEELISWLEFQRDGRKVSVGVNQEQAVSFLDAIAEEINVESIDAKFELNGTRVTEFQTSRDGKTLNTAENYIKLNSQISNGDATDIELVVDVEPAKVATTDLNDLGIKELLGRGSSNFSGSPVNRRHNIKTGVDSLNGVLIAPGEDFSLIDALGDIDGANGYLRELVIKGDRTIPEYGGGLCQIGSTTFRAALWSGLPVTARRNHSYRVAYYEPAGMDATIYDPAPDMRFLNDTGHHILFIARMVGDELFFEYYGTPDGRKVTIEPNPPEVYKVTQPGPPRYIQTDDLPPGKTKKVESAHPGADTYFKYSVEYPNGEVKEQDFYSHYVAWPEVWLIGRDPNATTTEELTEDLGN